MDRFLLFHLPASGCKEPLPALACTYLLGLIIGPLLSVCTGMPPAFVSYAVMNGRMSVIGSLSVIALPLFFSAFAVYVGRCRLVIPIAFCKAFLFSYTGCSVWIAFGSAGWLVFLLFMFSDILMLPVLWWYWQLALKGKARASLMGLIPASAAGVLIGSLDYFLIAPFLANLLFY